MKKKIILIIAMILIVFLVGFVVLYKDTDNIKLKDNQFIFELGKEISAEASYYLQDADSTKNIKDYKLSSKILKNIDNKFVLDDTNIVDVGEYEIEVIYKKKSQKFILKVVDTTSPEFIKFEEKLKYEQNTDISELESKFEATDLTDVKIIIEGEYDSTVPGEYEVEVIAVDESGNKTNRKAVIEITKKEEPKKETVIPNTNNSSSNNSSSSNNNHNSNSINNSQSNSSSNTTESSPRFRKDISDQYIIKLNEYRKANGLNELPVTAEAQAEADRRAKEIYTYYSHEGVAYGFGENIGEGSVGVDFFVAWKNSPSHNAAMLREQNTAVAASVYEINNHWYAVMSFKMDY
ncbi:MAG: CAP domain-containing protein [Firmicutes bacterium]|nr:CAP domain-containing protein [Clostridiales bacterium]MBE6153822.1 CAP domain-containing protein [Bacillota bacterium]